jgi:ribonuclease P protein component
VSSSPVGRISHRTTFVALRKPAGRATIGPLRVSWLPPGPEDTSAQVGYAIGKRCGTAVRRNLLRRRLREAVRRHDPVPGAYLVIADREAGDLSFAELASTVGSAMSSAARKGARP